MQCLNIKYEYLSYISQLHFTSIAHYIYKSSNDSVRDITARLSTNRSIFYVLKNEEEKRGGRMRTMIRPVHDVPISPPEREDC